MVAYCCVPLCENSRKGLGNVRFHCFPKEPTNRCDVWLARIGRIDLFMKTKLRVCQNYRVCGAHFSKKQRIEFFNRNKTPLLTYAVPDLNLPYEYCEFLPPIVEKDHNYTSLIIDEVPKSAITYQHVISQPTLEDMLICDEDFLNIKSTHICLFCMKGLEKTTEFNIQSNVTKEGTLLEAFIKTSLLFMNMDEHLESYFVCLICLEMVNVLEGYFTKCKNIQECLVKQYAEHKQSKENKNHSNGEELLTLSAVEDGRQTLDLVIQCDTKEYATRETQTYDFSTQMEEDSILNVLLSNADEHEIKAVDENIKKSEKKSTPKKKTIKLAPYSSSGYCCDKCGKVFWKYKAFKYHTLWHENRFQCEICNKSFVQQCNLKLHSLIHSGIQPHECEICGKKFRLRFQLDNHSKSVHPSAADSNGYCCETCGKLYVSYYGFKMHVQTHRYENKLRCEICDKSFVQPTGLHRHIRIHQGIRPFACEICGKRFSTKSQLEAHSNSHSGKRNYQCDTCGKAFVTGPNLTNHMKTHLTIKPYTCTGCGKGFSHNCNLKKHMKIVHKNVNI